MPFRPVIMKPGPKRIAAACALAGFQQKIIYPPITDGCGKVWDKPSALLIAVACAAGESSGNAWAYRINFPDTPQQSTDFGMFEINNKYNSEWFGPIKTPMQANWAIYYDCADMAYQVWQWAVKDRKKANGPPMDDWKPWHAVSGGGFSRERYGGKSWLDWAEFGIEQMNAARSVGATLDQIASIDMDPLVYD